MKLPILLLLAISLWGQNPESSSWPPTAATDTDLLVSSNNAQTTLNGAINNTDTSIVLTSASAFVTPLAIKIDNEFIKICSKSTNTLTVCSSGRGQYGSSAASHSNGATVSAYFVAYITNKLAAEVKALEGSAVAGPGSATDNCVARFDGTTGKLIQNSGVCVDDSNNVTVPGSISQGATPPSAPSGGSGAAYAFGEGTAPSANCVVSGIDCLYADSTAHRLKISNNGAAAVQFAQSGVDINTSDQVTATHLASPLPLAQGGTNCAAPFPVLPKTATYQVLATDFTCFTTITVASGTFTITLVASGSQPVAGTWLKVINYGSGVVTIARSGQNINGGTTSLTLPASTATASAEAFVTSDGTNYFASLSQVPVTTTCTNQFVSAVNGTAAATCTTITLAGAQFANQGTTTTLLHGNGSGNPSFGAVVNGDLGANAVDSSKMAVVNTRRVCDIAVGDTSGSALANGALGPQKRVCFIPAASTIVEMDVAADGGTPNVIVGVNHAGSVVNIVSSALATASSGGIACSKTTGVTGLDGATTCSGTLQNTSMAIGDYLELVSGTAGGTAKFMTIHVIYTIN